MNSTALWERTISSLSAQEVRTLKRRIENAKAFHDKMRNTDDYKRNRG
ncbi:hypothetical protein AAHB49_23340 [Bacillus cereus]